MILQHCDDNSRTQIKTLNSQMTPRISPSLVNYGVSGVRICEKNDRIIMAPHCISHLFVMIMGWRWNTPKNFAVICLPTCWLAVHFIQTNDGNMLIGPRESSIYCHKHDTCIFSGIDVFWHTGSHQLVCVQIVMFEQQMGKVAMYKCWHPHEITWSMLAYISIEWTTKMIYQSHQWLMYLYCDDVLARRMAYFVHSAVVKCQLYLVWVSNKCIETLFAQFPLGISTSQCLLDFGS